MWKLLSVLLAFVLWVFIAREPELATSISAPILFRNIPNDLEISSAVVDRVHLELRGPAGRLTPGNLSQTAVVLDLSGVQPGERTFTIDSHNVRQLPIGVLFYRSVPSQVSMHFERVISRDVPIEPVYSKALPHGYRMVRYWFSPSEVRVRGPEGRVLAIDHINTDPIDLTALVSHDQIAVHARVGDPQVRMESGAIVRFNVQMEKPPARNAK